MWMGAMQGMLALTVVLGGGWSGSDSPRAGGSLVAETARFAFHSDPWINLHHFLYQWSRADQGLGRGRQAVDVPERADLRDLDPADREAWLAALSFYREHVAPRDHFDDAMLELKTGLTRLDGDPSARPPDDIPGVAEALATAMPVYLQHWWPDHDAANRRWISGAAPLVRAHEEAWVRLAERSYGGTWSDGRVRVDASAYANWAGGYTSNGPIHTVVWSTDPGNQGLRAMELVFHESSHTRSLQGASREAIAASAQRAGIAANPNLYHALIFYTAGYFTRGVAKESGDSSYDPYAVAEGLTGFRGWEGLWDALDAEWPAVLRGERERQDAMDAVLRRLAARESGSPPATPS